MSHENPYGAEDPDPDRIDWASYKLKKTPSIWISLLVLVLSVFWVILVLGFAL